MITLTNHGAPIPLFTWTMPRDKYVSPKVKELMDEARRLFQANPKQWREKLGGIKQKLNSLGLHKFSEARPEQVEELRGFLRGLYGPLTCEDCGCKTDDVKEMMCPYAEDVHNKKVPAILCGSCCRERSLDI